MGRLVRRYIQAYKLTVKAGGFVLDKAATDGILISGNCGDALHLSGAFTGCGIYMPGTSVYAILISGVATTAGIYIESDCKTGILLHKQTNIGIDMNVHTGTQTYGIWLHGLGTVTYGIMFEGIYSVAAIYINSDHKLLFRDTGIFIHSQSDGQLLISSDGVGDSAIRIIVGSGGGIEINGYLRLLQTDVDGDWGGQLWYDISENALKYYVSAAIGVRTLIYMNAAGVISHDGTLRLVGTNQLQFAADNAYIRNPGTGQLHLYASRNASDAILLQTGAGGEVHISGAYLLLNDTVTPGSANGQMWYNPTARQFRGWADNAEVRFNVTAV